MTPTILSLPNLNQIATAHRLIQPYIHRTPILTCETLNRMVGAQLFFKCENLQKIGAFKIRGAMNTVLTLTEAEKQRGIGTHSSGNHAQAIAYAGQLQNIQAHIVMPNNSPQVKKDAVQNYGAKVYFCEPTFEARQAKMQEILQKTGAEFVHPYDDYRVITGQATCAKEIYEDLEDLDLLLVPIGGGGLLSGSALATQHFSPHTKVIGAEPALANDAYESLQTGIRHPPKPPVTIADGLRTSLGEKTFEIIRDHVSEIALASEENIIRAMRLIWERMKIIIEPSCAVPLATLLEGNVSNFKGKKIGIILTGGNVDLANLPWLSSLNQQ